MTEWVLETGLAVSLLIILVLLLRRPFARMFGAHATYTLWALPLIRLFMPEITIPAYRENVPSILNNITLSETFQPSLTATKPVAEISGGFNFGLGVSKDNMGPMVTGVMKPIIILPHNFCEDYSPTQQYFALVHELAHIKRFDLWAAFMVLMFRALNWPNPLVHYAAHKFRADQEAACDAFVLSKTKGGSSATQSYAETLVHAAKSGKSQQLSVPLGLALAQQNEDKNDD